MNTTWSSRSINPELVKGLVDLASEERHNWDSWGNGFEWVTLMNAGQLPAENSVPTITPWFRNADWNEREFAELFDVHVDGNTNPKRLFLDPEIDEGILNEVIPLTIMMNGACTKDMWERIMEVNAEPGEEVEKGVHE